MDRRERGYDRGPVKRRSVQRAGTVTNTGTITGATGTGIVLEANGGVGGGAVTNQSGGTISGSVYGIINAGAVATITNAGSISGNSKNGVQFGTSGGVSNQSTGTMADEAGVSLRTLNRLFRDEMDASPAEIVNRMRVDRARRALLATRESIEGIAHACGFGSLRRMDRAFARAISATPSEYRARFNPPEAAGEHAIAPPRSPADHVTSGPPGPPRVAPGRGLARIRVPAKRETITKLAVPANRRGVTARRGSVP